MAAGRAIRGSRVGSGPVGEQMRGELAPRVTVSYWCGDGHETVRTFSAEGAANAPETWDCTTCGLPGGLDRDNPPSAPVTEIYTSHLAYVKERRDDDAGAALLDEALGKLRKRRGEE
jgi:hypothetical protein